MSKSMGRSLVEGDDQLDRTHSHTCMESYHVSDAYFDWICHIRNSLLLEPIQPIELIQCDQKKIAKCI